jgi:hypothetical protein
MHERIERLRNHAHFLVGYRQELEEVLMAFADSIAKLQADVATLIAENGPAAVTAAVTAAVAAKDASDAAAVDAVDATVAAALPAAPAPAAPAAPAPATPAA